ncbi:type II toxin-antitoxin system RelE/ParE family toxin [Longimicrobium sp.]|uniref:type II toxin-antitoxin system RelE/ParE family toxin n=1 Tax=Longimicrobium sp. TaxID=2029185 RepID=UPI003B3A87E8
MQEFLDALTPKQADKIVRIIEMVRTMEKVPVEYFKKLSGTDNLWEVRAQQGGNNFRLLGFFDGKRLVVLVSGFAKKTGRTPVLEIELAHQRKRDYFSRESHDG